jgi:Ca2+-binding RTX toxin-like protein
MPKYGSVNTSVLADEINLGYWQWAASVDPNEAPFRRYWENFNSGNPTNITVDISGLQADSQALAVLALSVWQDVANITFTYVVGGGNITITETGNGDAATNSTTFYDALTNRLFITDSNINISRDWGGGPAAGMYSYYFQSLVHEIGHALGLGHSGNYNDGAVNAFYNTDSTLYANDTWQWSVMSYNDQAQYGSATVETVLTPQMADIYAIQATYGAATTRGGDTVYGFNTNAGNIYAFQSYTTASAFTIYDSGGIDTLDCSQYDYWSQTIDLRAGNWSSIGGRVDNIGIYYGVVIENAKGGSANDGIIGNDANNILYGGAGNDQIDGGLGTDTFYGGLGNDQFEVRNASDIIVENPGEGTDRYDSYVSIDALPANVEDIVLYGATDLYAIANDLANAISGSLGNNSLYGLDGADHIYGYDGGDWIDGGAGNDTMAGGPGDDTYQVDSAGDVVIENANEGTDQVDSYLSYTLGANVENLVLYGSPNINGTGNALANVINGNFGNNVLNGLGGNDYLLGYAGVDTLDGGTGADVLDGGAGNDRYYVDNTGDQVVEAVGGGTDTVYARVSYALQSGQEVEYLRANAGAIGLKLTGNEFGNIVVGLDGSDTLNGGGGIDTLNGGNGNDTYVVDSAADKVIEAVGGGTDLVNSSVSFALPTNVENLTLTGIANINATGNDLANVLTGNSGNNILDGRIGADTMKGGAGNDIYVVDNVGDVVAELAGLGTDTIQASITYALANTVENLTLTGVGNLNGTGNAAVNTLLGNSGNNILDGKAGADSMKGGAGNDTYVVDNVGDVITELAGLGTDTVQAGVTYTLAGNIENLTLTGAGNIGGTGNALANHVVGNAANNLIDGKAGNDVLTGGGGADSFLFDTSLASNVDTIVDYNAAADAMRLDKSIFTAFTTTGTLAAAAFRVGSASADADDRIIYNSLNGNLFYDRDGTGAATAVQFAHLNGAPSITNADFLVVA